MEDKISRHDTDEDDKTDIDTLVAWFEDSEEVTHNARKMAERDRDYYDHIQLTAKELEALRQRGQPDIIINRIQPKINFLIGFESTNRTDPRAFPRTPKDEPAAEAATDALRYVEDNTDLKEHFSSVWENMLIEGYGGVELVIEEGPQGQRNISAVGWDWDRLFYDPHARKLDFSDARYMGGVIWLDYEDAEARWPDAEDVLERTVSAEQEAVRTYSDRPSWKTWVTGRDRKRVRICQMYHREGGQWVYCVFTKGGKLESMPVPFKDQDGKSYCPMFLQSSFVNRDNERYGVVRQMIGVQDEINKRRSKALHRVSTRQVRSEKGAVDSVDVAKAELSRPDGWIETNPGFEFEVLKNGDQLAAELNMLQEAKNEIELFGPNQALLGKDENAPSGKAILANQQSGQTEIGVLFSRFAGFKKRVYMGIWSLIRQYKDEEWWIRVTDDEQKARFVGFNRPVTMAEDLVQRLVSQGQPEDVVQQQIDQAMQDPFAAQELQQVIRVENQPTQMNMDITVENVPDTANVQEEQFKALVQLAPAVTFPPKVYLQASSLRNKDQLLEELDGSQMTPEQQQAQQELAAIELETKQVAVEKTKAEIKKLLADALKSSVEADMAAAPVGMITEPQIQSSSASVPPTETGVQPEQPPPGISGDYGVMQ